MHEHVNYSSYKNSPSLAKGDNSRCSQIEKHRGFSPLAIKDDQTMHPSSKTFTRYQHMTRGSVNKMANVWGGGHTCMVTICISL